MNVLLQCPNGGTALYGDTCIFSCNPGYELQGSDNRTCLANQAWSTQLPSCSRMMYVCTVVGEIFGRKIIIVTGPAKIGHVG